MLIDAVVRNLEIIGEAAAHIAPEVRTKYSDTEWKIIVGLRNILIHNYSGIDLDIMWDIINYRLEPLETKVKQVLKEERSRER